MSEAGGSAGAAGSPTVDGTGGDANGGTKNDGTGGASGTSGATAGAGGVAGVGGHGTAGSQSAGAAGSFGVGGSGESGGAGAPADTPCSEATTATGTCAGWVGNCYSDGCPAADDQCTAFHDGTILHFVTPWCGDEQCGYVVVAGETCTGGGCEVHQGVGVCCDADGGSGGFTGGTCASGGAGGS